MSNNGWIAVDLDGTLAEYHGWVDGQGIGKPIPKMVDRVKIWLNEGKDVRIFTARAAVAVGSEHAYPAIIKEIEDWCRQHIGVVLPITCQKDFRMVELWDDRCKQIIPNSGTTIEEAYEEIINLVLGGE
jgi:hypothetical protein